MYAQKGVSIVLAVVLSAAATPLAAAADDLSAGADGTLSASAANAQVNARLSALAQASMIAHQNAGTRIVFGYNAQAGCNFINFGSNNYYISVCDQANNVLKTFYKSGEWLLDDAVFSQLDGMFLLEVSPAEISSDGSQIDLGTTVVVEVCVAQVDAGTVAVAYGADGAQHIVRAAAGSSGTPSANAASATLNAAAAASTAANTADTSANAAATNAAASTAVSVASTSTTTSAAFGGLLLDLDQSTYYKIIDNASNFADVPDGAWFSDAVAFVSAREIMNGIGGKGATNFAPDSQLIRAEMAQLLYNLVGTAEDLIGQDASADDMAAFADIESDSWYEDAVSWVAANGIMTGTGGGNFEPLVAVTREQVVTTLWRLAGKPQVDYAEMAQAGSGAQAAFADFSSVSSWAVDAMAWAVSAGVIHGEGNTGNLNAQGSATRAEVATMISRFCTLG